MCRWKGRSAGAALRQTSVAGRAIASWGHTVRLITIAVALTCLVVAGSWLLKVDVIIGPVSIAGR